MKIEDLIDKDIKDETGNTDKQANLQIIRELKKLNEALRKK